MDKIGTIFRKSMQESLKKGLQQSSCAFLMCYSGVKSADMGELRKELSQLGARVYVTRNTLAKRTLKDIKLEKLSDFLSGPTAFIYSNTDAAVVAKALLKFSQAHESVRLNGGFLSDKVLDDKEFKELANLPSRQTLYAMLLSTLNAPLNNLVYVLNNTLSKLLYSLQEIGKKK